MHSAFHNNFHSKAPSQHLQIITYSKNQKREGICGQYTPSYPASIQQAILPQNKGLTSSERGIVSHRQRFKNTNDLKTFIKKDEELFTKEEKENRLLY